VFATSFLAKLNAPHLRELQLSSVRLRQSAIPHLVEYLTSAERCRLHTFKCNGNEFGLGGMTELVGGLAEWRKGQNFHLMKMETFGNRAPEPGEMEDPRWTGLEQELKTVLIRNAHLQRKVQQQALALLHHSRPVLLRSNEAQGAPHPQPWDRSHKPWLPMELRLQILFNFAPDLSMHQRLLICEYASSSETLPATARKGGNSHEPPSLPSLQLSSDCIPDPGSLPLSPGGVDIIGAGPLSPLGSPSPGPGKVWDLGNRLAAGSGAHGGWTGCTNGQCLGAGNSVLCRREQQRVRWLEVVGCIAFEI
jgi:hypothetical protein